MKQRPVITWVIEHGGNYAWRWDRPERRVNFAEQETTADEWSAAMQRRGRRIVDDRLATPGNVWD